MRLRESEGADLSAMLALNQAEVPHVSGLDLQRLSVLWTAASQAPVAETEDGRVVAFALVMGPGLDNQSPNYRFFAARYPRFCYVDRVAVAADHRRRGIATALYDRVTATTDAPVVVCEVNLQPPNSGSLAFHRRRGFEEVERQSTADGAKRVALLRRRLDREEG